MAEFAKNIEYVWDKKGIEISVEEFNSEILHLQQKEKEINILYTEFIAVENKIENTLNEYQKRLYEYTDFSIFEPNE